MQQGGADLKITLKSFHGTFRFPTTVANSVIFVEPLSAFCKSSFSCMLGTGLGPCCDTLPVFILTINVYLTLDSRCADCLQQEASKLASSSGVQSCTFFSSLAIAKSALSRIQYQVRFKKKLPISVDSEKLFCSLVQGNPYYNEKGADSGKYYTSNGCPSQQPPVSTISSVEKISISVDDIGNTGCVGNISKILNKNIVAHVSPVPNNPFLVLLENGVDVCEGCRFCHTKLYFKHVSEPFPVYW
jgi:hypothetical protein